jgi:ABC-type antimicrobial peptide transport system permease subunit
MHSPHLYPARCHRGGDRTLIGIAIGVGFCLAQDHFKFFSLPQVYIVGWLPVLIKWTDVALIGIVAIVYYLFIGSLSSCQSRQTRSGCGHSL